MSGGNAARNAESFGDSLWTIPYSLRGTDLPHLRRACPMPPLVDHRLSLVSRPSPPTARRPSPIAHRPSLVRVTQTIEWR